jgi:acyl-CoA thioesterase-1
VVFLGTSLTAGLGLARDEDTYVSRLAELADSAGLPIRAVNAGVSGDTSADGLARLPWILRSRVDVLVVELGANDGLRGQDPDALARNLRAVIDKTRSVYPHVRIILLGMEAPPNMGQRYTKRFHDVFPRVAKEEHTAFVPFLLAGVGGVPRLNQADRMHPNAKGEVILAHNVWPVLERVLRSLPAERATAAGRGS